MKKWYLLQHPSELRGQIIYSIFNEHSGLLSNILLCFQGGSETNSDLKSAPPSEEPMNMDGSPKKRTRSESGNLSLKSV